MRLAAAAIILAGFLPACSDVKVDTFEIELTTDTDRHVVELWYQPDERRNKLAPLYRLRFPQNYYSYRDNHHALKQTTISLMLDRDTFLPWTEIVRRETGTSEALSLPGWRERRLKSFAFDPRFSDRQLIVTIRGSDGGLVIRRPPADDPPQKGMARSIQDGFQVDEPVPIKGRRNRPSTIGYSLSDPVIRMDCTARVNCGFTFDYRKSRVTFVWPRSRTGEARDVARRITTILDQHIVP